MTATRLSPTVAEFDALRDSVSPTTEWTVVNDNIKYCAKNGICFVILNGGTTGIPIGTSGKYIGQLPSGYRPSVRIVAPFNAESSGLGGQVYIETDGKINAYCGTNVTQIHGLYSFPL